MRILFCGGGTAGHVYPNLAIAETFEKNDPNLDMAYVTTYNGIENELVKFKKYSINVIGINKLFSFNNFKVLELLFKAIKESKKIINDFKPDIIIGTGGYATYPVIYAGHKLGVKTVLHESNSIPGKAIKHLEKYADKIFVNFDEAKENFKYKDKIIRTGNPLRQGYFSTNKSLARNNLKIKESKVILCFGGSLGAEKINECAIEILENLVKYRKEILFIWATGRKGYDKNILLLKDKRLNNLENLRISSYINNMPEVISASDIVICRAGAMTISEVAMCGKCTIFIPSPNVANNHQYINAKTLYDKKCASLIRENESYKLIDEINYLLEHEEKRKEYEENIKEFAKIDANKTIYRKILDIIK